MLKEEAYALELSARYGVPVAWHDRLHAYVIFDTDSIDTGRSIGSTLTLAIEFLEAAKSVAEEMKAQLGDDIFK